VVNWLGVPGSEYELAKKMNQHTNISMQMITSAYDDERPFTATRVIKPGSSTVTAPRVVSCYWSPIKKENLHAPTMTMEELNASLGCTKHKRCKGHLRMDPTGSVYMIPQGFAVGDELRHSDAHVMNKMVMEGKKGIADMSTFCFGRISGKRGILRKGCNGTRPTNTFRFVASPSLGPMNVVYLPYHFFDRGLFIHLYPNGRCVMKRLKEGDLVLIGRCPSQGSESALPMIAQRGEPGSSSIRIPLEMCSRNNADFDGDEMYGIVPATDASSDELREALARAWNPNMITNILESVQEIVTDAGGDPMVDPTMYSTMPLEDMGSHPGGKMYDLLMLKPKSWKTMYKTMVSGSYWKSWISRSEQGIVNTILGRHGIAGPYGYMRLGMMLGTCVTVSGGNLVVEADPRPNLPMVKTCPGMDMITCSSAMTKLTNIMYQRGIDMSKHGKEVGITPAMETMMKLSDRCYTAVTEGNRTIIATCPSRGATASQNASTTLESIMRMGLQSNPIQSAVIVTSMIEEIDRVMLTPQERIAVSVLFAFLSQNIEAVMETDVLDVVYPLGLDWYTSATCTDIRWLKNVIRNPDMYPNARMDTNINSVLGSIFLGNMSLITPENTGEHGDGTVKMNTDTEIVDWESD